jgi:hypothetical protein
MKILLNMLHSLCQTNSVLQWRNIMAHTDIELGTCCTWNNCSTKELLFLTLSHSVDAYHDNLFTTGNPSPSTQGSHFSSSHTLTSSCFGWVWNMVFYFEGRREIMCPRKKRWGKYSDLRWNKWAVWKLHNKEKLYTDHLLLLW